jgi:hypothetical protein
MEAQLRIRQDAESMREQLKELYKWEEQQRQKDEMLLQHSSQYGSGDATPSPARPSKSAARVSDRMPVIGNTHALYGRQGFACTCVWLI